MENFKIIVITDPDSVNGEAEKITRLLEAGVDFVHIRKPAWTLQEVKALVEDIPYPLRRRLKLHGHFALLHELTLGGVHLNSRCPEAPAAAKSVSKSCHSLAEVEEAMAKRAADDAAELDYATLSPIFDSISKEGYKARFDLDSVAPQLRGKRVVALGGVTPEAFDLLREKGFCGAALLGYIWRGDFDSALEKIKQYVAVHH